MNESSEKLQYLNLSAEDTGLCEYEGDKRLIWLPVNDIKSLSHGYGNVIRFPALALLLGIALVVSGVWFGVFPIIQAITYAQNYGFSILKGFGYLSLHTIFGFWLVKTSFRKGNFMLAETNKGPVKLAVKGEFDEDSFNSFLCDVKKKFGMDVP